jgi:hypothetical protein
LSRKTVSAIMMALLVLGTLALVFNISARAIWDNGYRSGGNYWSDYNGTDSYKGQYQNETGSDGIGDTPYVIDANNTDNYPLMFPWPPLVGDLNFDGKVGWMILFCWFRSSAPSLEIQTGIRWQI